MKLALPPAAATLIPGYALSIGVGWMFHLADVPLAFVLGALLASGLMSLSGVLLRPPEALRKLAQATIGAGIGLYVSAEVALLVLTLLPIMFVAGLVVLLVCSSLSLVLAHFARLDRQTAYYAIMPGGLAEMGNIAIRVGADAAPVAVAQALRVALVVILLPPLLVLTLEHVPQKPHPPLPGLLGPVLISACLVFSWVVRFTRLNNPWMLGAVLFSGTLTASGVISGFMPDVLFYGAQVLLGLHIGSRFRRDIVGRLPRLVCVYSLLTIALIAIVAAIALALQFLAGLDYGTSLLAIAPGGMAEMALTAETLGLAVATVTGFHVVRAFLVNGFATQCFALLSRIGFFDTGERLVRRLPWG